jgi:NitT/TauT family transport system substrate-binding protein
VTQEVEVKTIARLVTLTALAAMSLTVVDSACAETKIRFSLDWIPGSVHSPFFIALYKGYYQAEGLDVVIDRGKGSVGLVQQMASGVYDLGYPDISVVEDFDSKNPDKAFPVLMMGYEQAPAGIAFLKASPIKAPKDLEGKSLGAAASDGGFKLFPTFMQQPASMLQRSISNSSIPNCVRRCWRSTKWTPLSGRSSIPCWS